MPQVLNKRVSGIPPNAVYVGRPTVWGNPFSHRKHGTLAEFIVDSRDEAVEKYKEWLLAQPDLVARAKKELAGKDLVCWCFPCRCHAQVIIEVANEPVLNISTEPPPSDGRPSPTPASIAYEFTGRFRRSPR